MNWTIHDLQKKGFAKDASGNFVKGVRPDKPKVAASAKEPFPVNHASPQKLQIVIMQKLPGLNGSDGLIRENRFLRKKRKEEIKAEISRQNLTTFHGKVRLTLERRAVKLMDWENFISTMKLPNDIFVELGVILDDNPAIITEFVPIQKRVRSHTEECTIFLFENLEIQ